jgi:adenylate cyclase
VFCLRSWLLALSGRAKQGIACAERAIELSPLTTEDCRVAQCIAAYSAREYNSALRALDKIIEPTYEVGAYRAMCHAQLGNVSESRQAMTDYLVRAQKEIAGYPGVDTNRWERFWATRYPFKYAKDLDHMLAGLRKAGMP